MSISSSICADYANKKKEEWTKKLRGAYRNMSNESNAVREFVRITKEIEDFKFAE